MHEFGRGPAFGSGLSVHEYWYLAARSAVERAMDRLQGRPDAAFVFFTADHSPHAHEIAELVRSESGVRWLIGVSAEGVLAGDEEIERTSGLSVLLASLPDVDLHVFEASDLPRNDFGSIASVAAAAKAIGADAGLHAAIVLVDPFSVPLLDVLPMLNACRAKDANGSRVGDVVGGLASGSAERGGNRLVAVSPDRGLRVHSGGLVGMSLRSLDASRPALQVRTLVSQGCRPFGSAMVVTKSHKNLIVQLGGRPALEAIHAQIEELSEADRDRLRRGLFIGRVINEYRDRFGRNDFVIRNVIGADEASGAVAVQDFLRVGQTVQLHMRDAQIAHNDLELLLDAQRVIGPPSGVLLFTCNGRGSRLFGTAGHDARALSHAFASQTPGPELAKAGTLVDPAPVQPDEPPLAGFFAAGEIGPIANESHLHGHTACAVLFRPGEAVRETDEPFPGPDAPPEHPL